MYMSAHAVCIASTRPARHIQSDLEQLAAEDAAGEHAIEADMKLKLDM